jgi:phosphohistidine phosphatase
MKVLYVTRHAKSDWSNLDLDDFDRTLNERGKTDAPLMAAKIKGQGIAVDCILSSPAERAFTTSKKMAAVLGYPEHKINTDLRLYHANKDTLLEVSRALENHYRSVMLVGHNPGLTEFVNRLVNQPMDNIPTCGIVAVSLSIASWQSLNWGDGKRLFFYFPKQNV